GLGSDRPVHSEKLIEPDRPVHQLKMIGPDRTVDAAKKRLNRNGRVNQRN
ncbi:hypothetical protein HN51_032286, partial [Arachis hypogaea]